MTISQEKSLNKVVKPRDAKKNLLKDLFDDAEDPLLGASKKKSNIEPEQGAGYFESLLNTDSPKSNTKKEFALPTHYKTSVSENSNVKKEQTQPPLLSADLFEDTPPRRRPGRGKRHIPFIIDDDDILGTTKKEEDSNRFLGSKDLTKQTVTFDDPKVSFFVCTAIFTFLLYNLPFFKQ